MSIKTHFLGDNPISKSEEDLFNFKHYAEKIQRLIQLNSSNVEPFTIGIYGKWGEGKTSFLNLIENKVDHFEKNEGDKEYLKFHFNPWRFSNEDEMLFDFFDELSKKFYVNKNTNLQLAGKWISKYSKYLKAIKISSSIGIPKRFGTVSFDVSEVFKALGEDLSGKNITLGSLKNKVNEAIVKANFKVVVFIDDLDRLDKNEIYSILKLIKLNANFSNFIFIVNLDSEQVAKAIKDRYGSDVEDGKLFLEKIINIPIHLPKIEEEDLRFFFEKKLLQISRNLDINDKKEKELQEIIYDFESGTFDSPREILRVLNSFFIGAFGFESEINFRDLFWIEYLKVKEPDLYNILKNYNLFGLKAILNGQSMLINFNDDIENFRNESIVSYDERLNGTRKDIFEKFPKYKQVLNLLFPNKNEREVDVENFDNNLNVNSVHHFDKYFSFHTNGKVEISKIDKISEYISNKDTLSLKEGLADFFRNNNVEIQKKIYKIQKIIKNSEIENNGKFLFEFLFENLELIPQVEDGFGENSRLRIIKTIANRLNNSDEKNFVIELSKKIDDLEMLLGYIISFDRDKPYLQDIEKLFLEKSKEKLDGNIAFYNDSENVLNRWFLEYWSKYDPKEFEVYIEKSISNIDNIKHLIRNFSVIFNGKKFGALSEEKFNFMKKSINIDFIFQKINEFDSELIESVDVKNFYFDNYDETTLEHNIKQFIYWCKIYKNRDNIINNL